MEYKCNKCNKYYKTYQTLWKHNKEFHDDKNIKNNITVQNVQNIQSNVQNVQLNKSLTCEICNKVFNSRSTKSMHKKNCNNKISELDKLKEENKQKDLEIILKKEEVRILKQNNIKLKEERLQKQVSINKQEINLIVDKTNTILKETIIELKKQPSINNQLINLIVDKTNTIEELKTKIDENKINNNSLIEILPKQQTLNLNDVVVISRSEDNYINATQLCQAGGKQFAHWYSLDSTKKLINEAESDIGIPISQLIDIKKGNSNEFQQGSWIHPDLAIQLAQWISPQFALQVSKWIRTLFTTGNVSIDIQLLEDKNKEIKMKDNKIKLLENLCIKKQQRKEYPEKNVIYILTTEDNKKKRIYIIGKAKELKNRLSSYNKTSEHEVVYYKSCKSEEDMNVIELMVINKLKEYKEKANRDRFILPIEKNINLFTDIIDKSIEFY
jgi:hypothetical protein